MANRIPLSATANQAAADADARIDRLFAIVHVRPSGGEGIMAFLNETTGEWLPLVSDSRAVALQHWDNVRRMPEHADAKLRLLQFTRRAQVDEYDGKLAKQEKC